MKTKGQNLLGFLSATVLIACVVFVAVFGVGNFEGVFGEDGVVLGLDLVGGSRIVYEADVDDDYTGSLRDDLSAVEEMLRARLDMLGYTEATVTHEAANDRLVVEIPSVENPEEAVQLLGASAKLTFVDATGTVVLAGGDIVSAKSAYGALDSSGILEHYITLTLSPDAVAKFADATEAAAKRQNRENYIAIQLDGEEISRPYVSERIESETCIISGTYNADSASYLAGIISAGSLPFALREIQMDSVGATLGDRALETSLLAGGIGILLVMLFMIVIYRLPGVVAALSLTCYTALMGLLLSLTHVNLSLPGIAGIILSIGMAVDANVIVFERMKEELRAGKSTRAAFREGFNRAFTAIVDSNVTTLIAAVVLWVFGSGSIKGFAITLFMGVLLSMFTAVTVTRFLLARLVGAGAVNVRLYGVRDRAETHPSTSGKPDDGKFHFVSRRRVFAGIVAVMVLLGAVSFLVRGFSLDVDFTGGTTMQIDMSDYLTAKGELEISPALESEIVAYTESVSGAHVSSFQRAGGNKTQFILKMTTLETEEREALIHAIEEKYQLKDAYVYGNNVSGSISAELRRAAILSSVIAVALMLVYITFRFDLASGLAAIVCLSHDIFIMLTAYSLFGIPMNGTMIAAFLTILGYSINATIIIFDRVRENRRRMEGEEFGTIVNRSIRETLTRSLNTTITTFATVAVLYVLGVTSIREFALPLMVGIIAGLFSSVCLAGNLWILFRKLIAHKGKPRKEAN